MGGPVTCGDVKIYNEKQFHTLHLSVAKEMDIRMEGQSAGLKKEERYAGAALSAPDSAKWESYPAGDRLAGKAGCEEAEPA